MAIRAGVGVRFAICTSLAGLVCAGWARADLFASAAGSPAVLVAPLDYSDAPEEFDAFSSPCFAGSTPAPDSRAADADRVVVALAGLAELGLSPPILAQAWVTDELGAPTRQRGPEHPRSLSPQPGMAPIAIQSLTRDTVPLRPVTPRFACSRRAWTDARPRAPPPSN